MATITRQIRAILATKLAKAAAPLVVAVAILLATPLATSAATLTHGYFSSTVYFTRAETRWIADGQHAAEVLCHGLAEVHPSTLVACVPLTYAAIVQARRAESRHMCLKMKVSHVPVIPGVPPPVWFDIYGDSKYCR